jgi:hypothetical protein
LALQLAINRLSKKFINGFPIESNRNYCMDGFVCVSVDKLIVVSVVIAGYKEETGSHPEPYT